MSMKHLLIRYTKLITTVLFLLVGCVALGQVRSVIQLNDGWFFKRGSIPLAEQINFDTKNWEKVRIPHDYAIFGPFDKDIDKQIVAITQNNEKEATEKTGRTGALPYIGKSWYRNTFKVPTFKKGKRALLLFEGAMSQPKVYLNGKLIGQWNYGYSYFYFDISNELLEDQENTLAVHLSNPPQSSRWYPGAGLYRNVSLIVNEDISFEQWGVSVATKQVQDDFAQIHIKSEVIGQPDYIITEIQDLKGGLLAKDSTSNIFGKYFEQDIKLQNPQIWAPETPNLYVAVSKLFKDGQLMDILHSRFGIRTIAYVAGKGFMLNGNVTKFKGVCLHHDLGPLGTAVNKAALRRQMEILKDMGCNAIRSAHNMPSIEQLELADEMGFLFLAESFDEWAKPKVKNGYAKFFNSDAEKDIVNLVRATRNHPSIVMWSSGNEVPDQWGSEGVKRAKFLQDIFHREDPTRPVTVGMDQVKAVMESGFGVVVDIPGLNYRTHLYEEAYQKFPQGMLLGSETASTVSSRGVYKFPVEKAKNKTYDDLQSSSYDLESTSWSNLPEDDFILQDDKDWVIGEFVWTGFDYLGEPTPYDEKWPSRSSYFGISDLAGLPKDRFYLYRSRWNTTDNTLHILPHWNWPNRIGKTTPVFVYTNFDRAELFVNGKSMGIQQKNNSTPQHRYRLMWMDVKYEPGTLKVVAYNNDGSTAMEKEIHTAGEPYKIVLEEDRTTIYADKEDISFVKVSIVDKQGNLCPDANIPLQFEVSGAANFRAACNGDPTSLESFHMPKMKTFNGQLVVLVMSSDRTGLAKLLVKAKGLKPAQANITVK